MNRHAYPISSAGGTRLLRSLLIGGLLLSVSPTHAVGQTDQSRHPAPAEKIYLIIRTDDAGMSHSVNLGLEKLIESGLPVSVSVMFPTPWYQETVDILKRHPSVSVGIHLTLNSEWKNYRWGPVLGRSAVPTLVDKDGFFFPSSADLYRNNPDLGQVERELRAQIERAKNSGLTIDYLDYHMGTAFSNPAFLAIVERLAAEFGLGMSGYFGESRHDPQYSVPPQQKPDTLVAMVSRLNQPLNLVVTHVGIDNHELGALVDMNVSFPLPEMSKHRQGELDALTSPRFRQALAARNIKLITYRELIAMHGLKAMRRPGG